MRTPIAKALAVLCVAATAFVSTSSAAAITIDKATRYQTIDGFGAFMRINPWKQKIGPFYYTVDLDSVGYYDSLISDLGITIMRTFPDAYYEDSPGVYTVSNRMRSDITNIRKLSETAARQQEPLKFVMSVLSPPGWMKPSGSVEGNMEAAPSYYQTDCRLKDGHDDEFAAYLVKYLQTVKGSTGVDHHALNIQNEPAFQEPYASCVYNGQRFTSVSRAVGQAFEQAGIPTRLFGAEHMAWAFPNAFESFIRNDAVARQFFCAWAVHGYRDGVQADTGAFGGATPTDKPLWMSETSGGSYGATTNGLRDWGRALTLGRHILGYLRNAKISAWIWYYLMTNSGVGDFSSTSGMMADGAPTDKYFVSKHFYRYIRPGARQVGSSSSDGQVGLVAFWHEQNACLSIVLMNNSSSSKTVTSIGGTDLPSQFEMITTTDGAKGVTSVVNRTDQIVLPPNSITTLVAGQYRGSGGVGSISRPSGRNRATPRLVPSRRQTDIFHTLHGRALSSERRLLGSARAAAVYCVTPAGGARPVMVVEPTGSTR